jgi:integrase
LRENHRLRPRSRELYEGELRIHILPTLGDLELRQLTTGLVRTWHAELLRGPRARPSTAAKCYRLLRAILSTALEDGLITKNPCVIKGAGVERTAERPIATIEQVYDIAGAIEPRFRAMVLLATFTGLRLGELRGLRRKNIDLVNNTVRVTEQMQELADGSIVIGPPKSDAGRRKVAIPEALVPEIDRHMRTFAAPGADGLVFSGPNGQPFRRGSFYTAWHRAMQAVGIDNGLRFHDLRHTGNTLAASTGASTKELMARMGHSSPRAALIYQHASAERDAEIASVLSDLIVRQAHTNEGPAANDSSSANT